jgi:hypothetical protein
MHRKELSIKGDPMVKKIITLPEWYYKATPSWSMYIQEWVP